jgi:hypothetical protein
MQHNHIYRPYKDGHQVDRSRPIFYIIQHIRTGIYYAGYKKNKKKFLVERGYTTSSRVVNDIVQIEGLRIWRIMKIRYFKNANEARNYEVRFLKKVNAKNNSKFYNQTNGDSEWVCKHNDKETRNKMSISKRTMSSEKRQIWINKLKAYHSNRPKEHNENILKSKQITSPTTRYKMSMARKGKCLSNSAREKLSLTLRSRTSEEFESYRKKMSNSLLNMTKEKRDAWTTKLKESAKHRPKISEETRKKRSIAIRKAKAESKNENLLQYIQL